MHAARDPFTEAVDPAFDDEKNAAAGARIERSVRHLLKREIELTGRVASLERAVNALLEAHHEEAAPMLKKPATRFGRWLKSL